MNKKLLLVLSSVSMVLASCGGSSSVSSDTGKASSQTSASKAVPSSESSSSESSRQIEGLVDKDIPMRMEYHYGEDFENSEIDDVCHYSDYWFLENSSKTNYNLAVTSAFTGGMSYATSADVNGAKISNFLKAAGYTDVKLNQYYADDIALEDSLGVVMARKAIKDYEGKPYTLIAAFPRNAGYRDEWAGDFNLGASGMHEGFRLARDEMLRFLKQYITTSNITGEVKLWTAGYSRGAAAANLFAGFLADNSAYLGSDISLSSNNIFAYTIGTPATLPAGLNKADVLSVSGPRGEGYHDTDIPAAAYSGTGTIDPAADQYAGIHNFTAVGDYITKLPPKEWGFTRYGVVEKPVYGDEAMRKHLEKYSAEDALKFADKNYASELSIRSIDLKTFMIKDTNKKQSPDGMLNERISKLMNTVGSREAFVEQGYQSALASLIAAIGIDMDGFMKAFGKDDIGDLIKAGIINYLAYTAKRTNMAAKDILASMLTTVFGKSNKEGETYTDQQFLADFFDFLINDYQNVADIAAYVRSQLIGSFIPDPYKAIYTGLLDYAKTKKINAKTIDSLLFLAASYIYENKDSAAIQSLLDLVVKAVPADYVAVLPGLFSGLTGKTYNVEDYTDQNEMFKAMAIDVFEACVKGVEGDEPHTPEDVRYSLFTLISMFFMMNGKNRISDLILNGATDSSGNIVKKEPASLADFADDVIGFLLPKDEEGEQMELEAGADKMLKDLLLKGRNEKNGVYVDRLCENVALVREALLIIVLNPGEKYDLESDITNILQFVDNIQFLFPAHNHEMYISYLQSQADKQ
ncbi:MAG: hypothetical protein J6O18_03275 [Bacilli bacterium]|nr:hypothetical protein [Bacilli bacterium]